MRSIMKTLEPRYFFRFDDIAPGMDWRAFYKYMELLWAYKIRPLLGIIPENRDTSLDVQAKDPSFWRIMRDLQALKLATLAQHGYTHIYTTRKRGFWGWVYDTLRQSEFAGLSYEWQLSMISEGRRILQQEGIETDIWIPPSHTFDFQTLKALRKSGFKAVSDSAAILPFRHMGLVFLPQRLWEPTTIKLGITSICFHVNTADDTVFDKLKRMLELGAEFITAEKAITMVQGCGWTAVNGLYCTYFVARKRFQRLKRYLRKERPA